MSDIEVVDCPSVDRDGDSTIPHEVRLKVEFWGWLWLSVGGVGGEI